MMIETNYISGYYLGINAGFNSGINGEDFNVTINHLYDVLDNATPNGNQYWGGRGIFINKLIVKGKLKPRIQIDNVDQLKSLLN